MKKEDPIILLGAWNTLLLETFHWFDSSATEHLQSLTGVRLRMFSYLIDELHYQCVFEHELTQLRLEFEKNKTDDLQITYVSKIYDDFNNRVIFLENYLNEIESMDPALFTNEQIAESILNFVKVWTPIVMQIWYAVFLDIWYPNQNDYKKVKEIAAKARDHTGHLHARSNIIEKKIYREACNRLLLEKDLIDYLFPQEIVDSLMGSISYKNEAIERKKFCVTESLDGVYRIHSGNKARLIFNKYKPPSLGTTKQASLTGIPASKGNVKGIVRVIRLDAEFKDFKEGEVLVAPQTMVHYLPIMSKAFAILTEFGGLTSHAAIVSRELKKPCIVGIKNLLASVKNGDLVEVNADKGIVKILEKAR